MTGDNQKLYRWRCRAATYANWPTLRYMLRGNTVSDAPLIIGSLDPCYSCTDRMTVVDVRKKKSKVVPYKELERYSIERKKLAAEIRNRHVLPLSKKLSKPARRPRLIRWSRLRLIKTSAASRNIIRSSASAAPPALMPARRTR
ncbi:Formate hydrogenlyase subunit 5 [Salmonella enterica subsp. enterica]|nr:Formate hydrogenlyase subunit 5 [Salmonella enterica subsp. enterica]